MSDMSQKFTRKCACVEMPLNAATGVLMLFKCSACCKEQQALLKEGMRCNKANLAHEVRLYGTNDVCTMMSVDVGKLLLCYAG